MENDNKVILKSQAGTGEILFDVSKTGKKRDWKRYKEQSLAVSEAYLASPDLVKYGENVLSCASYLHFKVCMHGHGKKLFKANFCRGRFCPTCQWRKSLVIFHQVLELIHAHREKYTSDVPLLLTLTVPNVSHAELKPILARMQKSWDRLTKRMKFKRAVRSWFRSLEVTYNAETDTFHPHFHILLLVSKNYFTRGCDLYIDRDEWLSMWQEVTGISEITQVDIRRVKKESSRKPLEAISAEVARYATKPSSYIKKMSNGRLKAFKEVVKTLHYALKGRRLVAFGGLFNELRKALKQVDVEEANLVQITIEETSCMCLVCQSSLIDEIYYWSIWLKQYIA